MSIRITVKGLAKFMTTRSEASKRKVLHDFRYPSDEARAQAKYYQLAITKVKAFHRNEYVRTWLLQQADSLTGSAGAAEGSRATRLQLNAKALRAYEQFFAQRRFEWKQDLRLGIGFGDVVVAVNPELFVTERNRDRVVVLGFTKNAPPDRYVPIVCQTVYEAVRSVTPSIPSRCIHYFDVFRGDDRHEGRHSARLSKDIRAACEMIESWWPSI